jgi:predicted kinase
MSIINLPVGGVYVLSGPYSTGKSTLLLRSNLPEGFVVSSDALRRQVLGVMPDLNGADRLFEHADGVVHDILAKMVEARAAQRLTTIIDAPNLNDEVRGNFFRIAEKYGTPFKTLILDAAEDVALARNTLRNPPVLEQRIKDSFAKFQRHSHYPFEVISDEDVLSISLCSIPHTKLDVIGDVHGLYDDLVELLRKAGWTLDATGVPRHADKERLLVFLGDLIDRGQDSLKVLKLVKAAVEAGVARSVMGNHEAKLLRFWDMVNFKGVAHWSSFASAETGVELLKADRAEAEGLVKFLRTLPPFLVQEDAKVVFLHADVNRFDPLLTPKGDCLYGHSKHGTFDSDADYQERFDEGLNKYTLIRGHRSQISPQANVFSLERDQAFKGELVLLQLDQFVALRKEGSMEAFHASVLTQACTFDFDTYSEKFALAKAMDSLVSAKLAIRQDEPQFGLKVYRYHKRVFHDRLWGENPFVVKARGLILDVAGNIVSHPFDKVYIYGENGAGEDIADDRQVIAVDKLNGFALNISKHPFKPNELLITTQGSFDCNFIEYGKSFITPKMRGQLLKALTRKDVTLMFEVLHPADPHIVEYTREQHGLYLVGVRGKDLEALPWTEAEVDSFAKDIGVRRPAWFKIAMGDLRKMVRETRTEGFMVREYSSDERFLFKWKSPFYLVTKYLGRLTNEEIVKMYSNPDDCKRVMSEQYRPVVDELINAHAKESFLAFGRNHRIGAVRSVYNAVVA